MKATPWFPHGTPGWKQDIAAVTQAGAFDCRPQAPGWHVCDSIPKSLRVRWDGFGVAWWCGWCWCPSNTLLCALFPQSRVIVQQPGERSFHSFYQVCVPLLSSDLSPASQTLWAEHSGLSPSRVLQHLGWSWVLQFSAGAWAGREPGKMDCFLSSSPILTHL